MSDLVLIALIAGGPSTIGAILGFVNNVLVRRTAEHIKKTKEAMDQLERNTNSKMDKLVEVVGEAEHAKGLLEGKAENNDKEK